MTARKRPDAGSPRENVGAILKGLGEILERLGDLGGEVSRRFEFSGAKDSDLPGEKGKSWQGVYGFSVKVGGQGGGVKVEPFGNVQRPPSKPRSADAKSGARPGAKPDTRADAEAPVHEIREPIIDTFEEGEAGEVFRIIAEMPGISQKDLSIELEDDILSLTAKSDDKHYHKEILLPHSYPREALTVVCNNGIVDIQLRK